MRTPRHGFDISYAMIDLFSSGLAAGLMLFFLAISSAKQSGRPPESGIKNASALVALSLSPGDYTPLLLIKTPDNKIYEAWPHRFQSIAGKRIVPDAPGTKNGRFELVSQTSWDVPASGQMHKLLVRISNPDDGQWCFGVMIPEGNRRFRSRLASDTPPVSGDISVFPLGVGQTFKVNLGVGSGAWLESAVDLKKASFQQAPKQCAF